MDFFFFFQTGKNNLKKSQGLQGLRSPKQCANLANPATPLVALWSAHRSTHNPLLLPPPRTRECAGACGWGMKGARGSPPPLPTDDAPQPSTCGCSPRGVRSGAHAPCRRSSAAHGARAGQPPRLQERRCVCGMCARDRTSNWRFVPEHTRLKRAVGRVRVGYRSWTRLDI